MDESGLLLPGSISGRTVSVLSSGRFAAPDLLPGAWLAAYTPLDGAMLLTSQPPAGFIGVQPGDMRVHSHESLCTFTFPNLSGMDLRVELRAGLINMFARNHTRNPLPISLAFSWQDLSGRPPRGCQPAANGLTLLFGGGSRIHAACAHPRTRFSFCLGWDPAGSGEEVWDDYFASGELSNQHYLAAASAVCAHSLVSPDQEFSLSITFENGFAD
jgi:hypothetical protein